MKVNKWRVYLNPFDDDGNYSGYVEITDEVDLSSISKIESNLDNTDYDIGIYRNSNISLKVSNRDGHFSDVGGTRTYFHYKRSDSLIKITWEVEEDGPFCGDAYTGSSWLSEETQMFVGLLNDESASMDVGDQYLTFSVLGRESLFQRCTVPASVTNADLISVAIYECLNQTIITDLLTVSQVNIVTDGDVVLDSVTDLANKTVKQALDELLFISNSVLYISGDTVYVSPRDATAAVQFHFYGQASNDGAENISDIKEIISGLRRTFNKIYWNGNATPTQDLDSVNKYGVRRKEISSTAITDSTKQNTLMAGILAEFKDPKMEFDLYTPLTYDTLALDLLDRIDIDYPTVYVPSGSGGLPICGVAVCGTAQLPGAYWQFEIDTTTNFKITGRSLDVKNSMFKFKCREI